jgi:putative AbiEii toxin of type IV toxin-antitoxin system/AAA domain-containing protein
MTSLSIRDFRGIDHLELDFSGPDGRPNGLAVLAGPNGCGKTAVLEAALIGAGGSKLITGMCGRAAIRQGAKDYEIKAAFREDTTTWETRDVSGFHSPPLSHRPVPHWYFSSWRVPQLVGPIDATVGRRSHRPAKTDQNRLLNVKQRLVNLATIDRFQTSTPDLGRYEGVIKLIINAWREFYPDGGHQFAVEVVASRNEDIVGSFDVYVRTPDGVHLEVDLLGAGQLELFLFLSELALNEDREGIIFIDEPELHLDPQWHRLILRSLRRLQPRAQLIVATHSPEIYDAAASYERHYLVPDDDPRSWLWAQHKTVESGV